MSDDDLPLDELFRRRRPPSRLEQQLLWAGPPPAPEALPPEPDGAPFHELMFRLGRAEAPRSRVLDLRGRLTIITPKDRY